MNLLLLGRMLRGLMATLGRTLGLMVLCLLTLRFVHLLFIKLLLNDATAAAGVRLTTDALGNDSFFVTGFTTVVVIIVVIIIGGGVLFESDGSASLVPLSNA